MVKVKQLEKQYYNAFKKALVDKGETLKSFCEKNELDYMRTYQAINAKWINLDWLEDLYKSLGTECWYDLRISHFATITEVSSNSF